MKNVSSIHTIKIAFTCIVLSIAMLCSSSNTMANNSKQENLATESAADIIILFDQSQSMNYLYPTPVVEKIIEKLVEKFNPQYPITITGFSEIVIEHFKIEVNNAQQKISIKDKFLHVNTRQKITNFEPALRYLVNYPNKINRVILITDGKSDIWDEKLRHLSLNIRSDDRYRDLNLQFFKLKKSGYTHLQRFEKLNPLYEERNHQLISSLIDEINSKAIGQFFIIQLDKVSDFLSTWSKQAEAKVIAISVLPENPMILEQKLDQAINQIIVQNQPLTSVETISPSEKDLNTPLNISLTEKKLDLKTGSKNSTINKAIVKTVEVQKEASESIIKKIKTELTADNLAWIENTAENNLIANSEPVDNRLEDKISQPTPTPTQAQTTTPVTLTPITTITSNKVNQSITKENKTEVKQQLAQTESKKDYNNYLIIICILVFIYWLLKKKSKTSNLNSHSKEESIKKSIPNKKEQSKAFNSRIQLRVELNPGQMDVLWQTDSGVQKSASVVNISLHALLFTLSSTDKESLEIENELNRIKTIKINKTNETYKLKKIKIEARNDGTYVMFLSEFEEHINTSMHWIDMLTRIDEDTIK